MLIIKILDKFSYSLVTVKKYYLKYYLKLKYKDKIQLENSSFGNNFSLDIKAENFLLIIGNSMFKNYGAINIRENGKLIIGSGVTFNSYCTISCLSQITIGNNTIFGSNVNIYDHNHEFRNSNILIKNQGYNSSPVFIGDNCWIGTNVTILKGVSIGSNSVIGTGVVVFKNVPENTVLINKQNQSITI